MSLIARLHSLYQEMKDSARKYQAVMLCNHRTHTSILCLPSSLFYESTIHVSIYVYAVYIFICMHVTTCLKFIMACLSIYVTNEHSPSPRVSCIQSIRSLYVLCVHRWTHSLPVFGMIIKNIIFKSARKWRLQLIR